METYQQKLERTIREAVAMNKMLKDAKRKTKVYIPPVYKK